MSVLFQNHEIKFYFLSLHFLLINLFWNLFASIKSLCHLTWLRSLQKL